MMRGFLRRMIRAAVKRRRRQCGVAAPRAAAWLSHGGEGPAALHALEPRLLMSFDPTASEQLMLELVNRMRMDPSGELARLTTSLGTPARSADSDIDDALVFFGVNGTMLAEQFSLLAAAPPLAWNESLIHVAEAHNQAMIAADVQSHEAPGEPPLASGGLRTRFNDQGYSPQSTIGENIFAFGESALHAHAGFAIDWGDEGSPGGIQTPAGHREAIMNAAFREVGIRITPESNPATDVGPLVITQDFGGVAGSPPYLLGVAFNDADGDAFYDIGEGLGGVSVQVVGINGTTGEFNATSMTAGGWQVAVPAGTYRVTFSGGGLAQTIVRDNIIVTTDNVKIDSLAPEIDVTGNSVSIVDGDTTPTSNDHTGFGNVQVTGATLTRTFTIHNTGAATLNLTGSPRVQITGTHADEFTVISQPAAAIEPGASSTFQVRFDPAATGLRTATVNIINDDGDESPYDFAISGVGVAPEIAVGSPQGGSVIPIANGDTTPSIADHTDMGSVTLGGGAAQWTFRITATGTLNLTGSPAVAIGGTDASAFTVVAQPSTPIVPPGGQTTATRDFTITFNPQRIGLHQATVTILSDDPDQAAYTFAIQGAGIANRIGGAVEDADFIVTHAMLNAAMRESGTSDYVIDSVASGTLLKNGVPIVPGVTTIGGGESLTWQPPANGNRTIGAFSVKPFVGGAGVGSPELIRIEVTPVDDSPTGSISDIALGAGGPSSDQTLNLADLFSDADINGTVVRISTSLGDIDVHLFDDITPATVANFMNYAAGGDWVNTIVHRVVTNFVVQAGGFRPQLPALRIPTDPPVVNEFAISSQRGTLAMAKSGNVIDSATSEWFFNLGDNGTNLDNQNGGFTVFGEVIGDGMMIVDQIVALPRFTDGSQLTAFPLRDYVAGQPIADANWIKINSVTAIAPLSFAIVGNTNPALVAATLDGASLNLDMAQGVTGAGDITIRATDLTGRSTEVTFTVSIAGVSIAAIDSQAAEPIGQEPANPGVFRITRTGSTAAPLTVHYTVAGTATNGGDYQAIPLSAVIPAGQTSVDITITPLADGLSEGNETVILTLSANGNYTITGPGGATVNIAGDMPSVAVTSIDATAAETNGNQPANTGLFRFSRDGNLGQPLTVHYTITGPAQNGVDYQLIPQTITIPASQSSIDLGITPIDDGISEFSENVTITLASNAAYAIDNDRNSAAVTILDNDAVQVQIAAIQGVLSENTPQTPGVVRISRTGSLDAPLVVKFARGGKAKFGPAGDYTLSIGQTNLTAKTVSIPAGQAFVDININVIDDTVPDAGEVVLLKLAAGKGYTIPAAVAAREVSLTIADNEPTLAIASTGFIGADNQAAERGAGETADTAFFRITRDGSIARALDVKFKLSGTAKGKGKIADYTLVVNGQTVTGKVLTIPAGADFVDVFVMPVNDALVETTETVILTLGANKKAYSLPVDKTRHGAMVTIADNEPTVSIVAVDPTAAEPGGEGNTGRFRISRTGNTGDPLEVTFKASGTAKGGSDYAKLGTKITIPAGAAFVDLDINPLADALAEPTETVILTLAKSKSHHLSGNASSATVNITNGPPLAGADLTPLALTNKPHTFRLSAGNTGLAIAATIKNQGNAATTGNAQVRVLLSKDRTGGEGDIQLGFMTLGPLAAGKSGKVAGNFNITGLGLTGSAIGGYFIILVVDHNNAVAEAIETNNTLASQLANVIITA